MDSILKVVTGSLHFCSHWFLLFFFHCYLFYSIIFLNWFIPRFVFWVFFFTRCCLFVYCLWLALTQRATVRVYFILKTRTRKPFSPLRRDAGAALLAHWLAAKFEMQRAHCSGVCGRMRSKEQQGGRWKRKKEKGKKNSALNITERILVPNIYPVRKR